MASLQSPSEPNNENNSQVRTRFSELLAAISRLPSRQTLSDSVLQYAKGTRAMSVENFDIIEAWGSSVLRAVSAKTASPRAKLANTASDFSVSLNSRAMSFQYGLEQAKAWATRDNDARRLAAFKGAMVAFERTPSDKNASKMGYWMAQMAKDSLVEFQSGVDFLGAMKAQAPQACQVALSSAEAIVAPKGNERLGLLMDFARGQVESVGQAQLSPRFASAAVKMLAGRQISSERFAEVLKKMPAEGAYEMLSAEAKTQGYKTMAFDFVVAGALAKANPSDQNSIEQSAAVLSKAILDGAMDLDIKKNPVSLVVELEGFEKLMAGMKQANPALHKATLLNVRDLSRLQEYGQVNDYLGDVAKFEYRLTRFEENPTKEYPWLVHGLMDAQKDGVLGVSRVAKATALINKQDDGVRAKVLEHIEKLVNKEPDHTNNRHLVISLILREKLMGIRPMAVPAPKKSVDWSSLSKEEILKALREDKSTQVSFAQMAPVDEPQAQPVKAPKPEAPVAAAVVAKPSKSAKVRRALGSLSKRFVHLGMEWGQKMGAKAFDVLKVSAVAAKAFINGKASAFNLKLRSMKKVAASKVKKAVEAQEVKEPVAQPAPVAEPVKKAEPAPKPSVIEMPETAQKFFEDMKHNTVIQSAFELVRSEMDDANTSFLGKHIEEFIAFGKEQPNAFAELMSSTCQQLEKKGYLLKAAHYRYVSAQGKFAANSNDAKAAYEYGQAVARLVCDSGYDQSWADSKLDQVQGSFGKDVGAAAKLGVALTAYEHGNQATKTAALKTLSGMMEKPKKVAWSANPEVAVKAVEVLRVLNENKKVSYSKIGKVLESVLKPLDESGKTMVLATAIQKTGPLSVDKVALAACDVRDSLKAKKSAAMLGQSSTNVAVSKAAAQGVGAPVEESVGVIGASS